MTNIDGVSISELVKIFRVTLVRDFGENHQEYL